MNRFTRKIAFSGTSLCPPEFDVFNKVTLPTTKNSSADEDSEPEKKPKRRKIIKPPQKPLPESLKALKKKYTEQRLANKNTEVRVRTTVVTRQKTNDKMVLRTGLRGTRRTRASSQGLKTLKSKPKQTTATSIAAKKRKMAVLKASNSRMLARLTPRGTSSAAFVRKVKKMPLEGKSLRGRDISLSSEEDEEAEVESETAFKGRKMVCRKTASNVQRDSDSDEEMSEIESEKSEKPGRPARKTKEAATVYLNMLGQKLTKKAKSEDEISIESLSEATQGKRMKEIPLKKVKYKEKKIITPSIIKKKPEKNMGESPETDSEKTKKEKKSKNILKEMQDRLLEEAKKKIASTPEAAPLIPTPKTEPETKVTANPTENTAEKRVTYIQVKPRTASTEDDLTSVTSVQPQRRLSVERMSTPPRKILPKEPVSTAHLPVGVVGAALSNTRPTAGTVGTVGTTTPVKSETGVPLSQPLLINTNPASVAMASARPLQPPNIIINRMPAMPMQNIQIRPTSIPTQGIPTQGIPTQGIPTQGIPIIMPQIALPNGSILQPVQTTSALLRPPFPTPYAGQMVTSFAPMMQQRPPVIQQPSTKCTTDVTHANTQPLVSPGPPLLSPQQQQQLLQQAVPQVPQVPKPLTTIAPPPLLAPAGLPVTSGAVSRFINRSMYVCMFWHLCLIARYSLNMY